MFGPFRAMFGRFAVPRAALRDVPSLRSALGYDVAAPFGAEDGELAAMFNRSRGV